MPNRVFFFSDIDDTLIQTKRKTDFNKKTIVGSYNKAGEESSFFYEGVKVFLDAMIDSGINVIPTTARNLDSYKRTVFYTNKKIKNVVLNFGGLILINNEIDKNWENKIRIEYTKIDSFDNILDKLSVLLKNASLDVEIKIIDNYYISLYNRNNLDNSIIILEIKNILSQFVIDNNQFYIYENDNSFGILPKFLNKKFAVEYLIKRYKPILTIGSGDNISDLEFMKLADFKLLPEKFII
jgi:hydroxymethylpyrimidine pyrophosphatase-like HAD family hydrolase